jgi:hypothetical protein
MEVKLPVSIVYQDIQSTQATTRFHERNDHSHDQYSIQHEYQ